MGTVTVDAEHQHSDLVAYLAGGGLLTQAQAARVVDEVLGYFCETPQEFTRRRHAELQAGGLTNDRAFSQIAAELRERRFAAPELSARQLRRIVYG